MLNYLERLQRAARESLSAALTPRERAVSAERRALRLEPLDPRLMLSVTPGDTVVTFNFTIAGQQESIQVELFNNDAPQTVANFLSYVTSGSYTNTFIHRMVEGFVVQGGGYSASLAPFSINAPANGIDPTTTHIPTNAPVQLEYSAAHPNAAGTLAMARTSDPNSATSEWFFNTVDNSSSLGPGGASPDGYAVFGQILGNGLQVIQQINALSTLQTIADSNNNDPYFSNVYSNLSSADQNAVYSIKDVPFTNYNIDSGTAMAASNLVVLNSITVPEIAGSVFADLNSNGSQGAGEQGLSGWSVYIDQNNNGSIDSGEPVSQTDANGTFSFFGVPDGTYILRAAPQAGWTQSVPNSGGISVTITNGQSVLGQKFGEVLTLTAPNAPVLSAGSDSGVGGDNVTNITLPTLTVSGVRSGATVQLYDDQNGHVLIGSATASGTTVSVPVTQALAGGPHKITAVQTEFGFASVESSQLSLNLDLDAPLINQPVLPVAPINQLFSVTLTSNDPAASWALGDHPAGMTIDPVTGVVNWTPTGADVGFRQFAVMSTDVAGNTGTKTLTLAVDGPPVFAPIGDQVVNQGSTITILPSVNDINPPLSYTLGAGAPAGASFDPATGQFVWSPTAADAPGGYQFTITVTDTTQQSATQTVKITVIAPPVIDPIADATIDEGKTLSIPLSAVDQGPVTFVLLGAVPSGASAAATNYSAPSGIFVTSSGVFTWTPSEAQGPGVYTLTLQAVGAGGMTATRSFQVTVNEVDTAPVIAPLGTLSVHAGSTVSVAVNATDADLPAQQLIYSLEDGAPVGATIDPNTGLLSWAVPADHAAGIVYLAVRVTEVGADGLSAVLPVTVNVTENPSAGFSGFALYTSSAVNLGGYALGLAIDNGVPINSGLSISPFGSSLPGSLPTSVAGLQQLAGVAPSGPAGFTAAQAALTKLVDLVIGFDSGIPHDGEGMQMELARYGGTGGAGSESQNGPPTGQVERARFDEPQGNKQDNKDVAPQNDSGQLQQFKVPAAAAAASASRANSFWGTPQERAGFNVGAVGGHVYRPQQRMTSVPRLPSDVSWRIAATDEGKSTARTKAAGTAAASAMVMPLLVSDIPGNQRRKPRRLFSQIERLGD